MKRTVPLLITAVVGFVLVFAYFTPFAGDLGELAMIHFDILAAIAFILGGGNLLRTHGEKIYKQNVGWGYSMIAVVCFLVTLAFGLGKFNVQPTPGYWTNPVMRSGDSVAFAQLEMDRAKREGKLTVFVRKAEPGPLPVTVAGTAVGTVEVGDDGQGRLVTTYTPPYEQEVDVSKGPAAANAPDIPIQVGSAFSASLRHYPWITGIYNENGGYFWWMYEYWFKPLQMTTFAMLAFYVASAAFRAFRAKNIESVLLLGTAFVILLGRTFLGTYLSSGLVNSSRPPEGTFEQFLSFFYIPNLTGWFMAVFNTAGNRAIMIGIALGVASTSLKVLLGIDRSYLGSDKG